MSAKDNLNEAMFSMFGVGKAPASEAPAPAAAAPEKEVVAPKVKEEPVVQSVAAAKPATYLAPGSSMEGKLKAQGDVDIAGIFKGDIEASGKVTLRSNMDGNICAENLQLSGCCLTGDVNVKGIVVLDEKAVVNGKIIAGELICAGHIKGDLDIKGNVSLKANTSVEGNICAATMTMEQGAIINGSLTMKSAAGQKK